MAADRVLRHPAVVDCGSNSTRLWLAPIDGDDGDPVRLEQVTRLGRGVDRTGRLDDDRLAHCLDVVADYAARWRAAGIDDADVAVVATSAVRDAADRDRFFDGIRRVAGTEARVLSGEGEALASFTGAVGVIDPPRPALMVDIGGGSTELVVGPGPEASAGAAPRATSRQMGTVRLTERHLLDDPPTADQVAAARREAGRELADGLARIGLTVPAASPPVAAVVAVAGTATTLAALDRGRDDLAGLHGHRLGAEALSDLTLGLLSRSADDRHELGPLAPGRADVIAAGALVLATLVDLLGVDEVVVSIADVLDGIAHGAADGPEP